MKNKKELQTKDAQMLRDYQNGKITEAQYKAWRMNLEKQLAKDTRIMASILGGADQLATEDVNMDIPEFYSDAENYQTYQTEKELGIDTNYALVNKNSITRAMYGDFFADVDKEKNSKWNQRRIRSAITQGIISGEGIDDIANRLVSVCKMNEASAQRNARTWVGAAVTGGRQESAEKSARAGVDLVKYWDAVIDLKTRISHRHMHMEMRELDEEFSNGGMYPRDPSLKPAERYNCRCDVLYYPRGFTPDFNAQTKNIGDMSYDEWLSSKKEEFAELTHKQALQMAQDLGQDSAQIGGLTLPKLKHYFQTWESFDLDDALRRGLELTNTEKATVDAMDSLMKPLPKGLNLVRYSGERFLKSLGYSYKSSRGVFDHRSMIGLEWQNDGYTSTSYMNHGNVFTDKVCEIEILAPKGTNVLFSPNRHRYAKEWGITENEVVIARGAKFRVKDAWEFDDDSYGYVKRKIHLVVEVI